MLNEGDYHSRNFLIFSIILVTEFEIRILLKQTPSKLTEENSFVTYLIYPSLPRLLHSLNLKIICTVTFSLGKN